MDDISLHAGRTSAVECDLVDAHETETIVWKPILPVPADAADLPDDLIRRLTPKDHRFIAKWAYRDSDGRLLGYTVRYDGPVNGSKPEKQVKPFTYCAGSDGKMEWRSQGFPEPRPLYGLDRLAARPNAPVLVVEGEKTADAAMKLFPSYVVITSPGGSGSARKCDWGSVARRLVVACPDADDPGKRYAEDVADMARRAGAASVHVVKLPSNLPKGWDLADQLPAGLTNTDLTKMLANAQPAPNEGPIPLFPTPSAPERFPTKELGPVLSSAAAAISRKVQVPEAIAAQSVLAAAALAAQAHANVKLPYGQTRPLSLFFVTVAASGDRKSTADNEALWPIHKREKFLKEEYEDAQRKWSIEIAAYSAEKKRIEGDRKMDIGARKAALTVLGPEPEKPLFPFLTAPEPTIEGLVKAWVNAPAALGLFAAEGGQFIGGHGMSQDHRLKTAAALSEIWDGHPIKRIRSGDGVSILHGRRLSMHLMVQHEVAAHFLSDDLLHDQGLLSRILVAAPESIAGTRLYHTVSPEDEQAIRAYGARILSILEARWPLARGSRNELEPRHLIISSEAAAVWRAFYDHIESQCGLEGELRPVQDFAAKAAEHAARIAGVLTIIENLHATEIRIEGMCSAIRLAEWYVAEAARLQQAGRTDPKLIVAKRLLEWMSERGNDEISVRDITQFGPAPARTKAAAEGALSILIAHGWVQKISDRPYKVRVVREA